jgi:5'(3')-deoxyribonucleotidase
MVYKKIIKIDVDGVLRDMLPKMCECYNAYFRDNISPNDIKSYDTNVTFHKCKEILGRDASDWLFQDNGYEIYNSSPMCYKAKEAMDMLKEMGYFVIIVSHQKSYLNQFDTINWLGNHGIHYDSICFTPDKSLIVGDIMVDDNLEFLAQCENNNEQLICVKAPYNENDKYLTVESLYHYVSHLYEDYKNIPF